MTGKYRKNKSKRQQNRIKFSYFNYDVEIKITNEKQEKYNIFKLNYTIILRQRAEII